MSLEFSQDLETPIISPSFVPQDAGEIGLRPKMLSDYTGQEKAKGKPAAKPASKSAVKPAGKKPVPKAPAKKAPPKAAQRTGKRK